jgi:hypothetical protein
VIPTPARLARALWVLFLAACAAVMFLGGLNFLFGTEVQPQPLPVPTETATVTESPTVSMWSAVPDDEPLPVPSVCTDADARGVIPRDIWTPCGQLLGYFDDQTPGPRPVPSATLG